MKYDFDTIIERRGTNSEKYDFAKDWGKEEGLLPLWVADMDFKAPPAVQKRLAQAVEHGIFGYSSGDEGYYRAVISWYEKHFSWKPEKTWMIQTPGVVFAIASAIRAFTKEGEAVLIQRPVYYPFSDAIENNKRKLVNNPLRLTDGRYEIDFEDFEEKIRSHHVKLFILCSPHNPVGRVWKEWELRKMGEICLRHHVTVVSDEIHSDFVYEGNQHRVFASLSREFADITVTCTAPSKTFNLAGLQVSNLFISNEVLREKLQREITATGYGQINRMGILACQAAYEEGEDWLAELLEYLKGNLNFVRSYLEEYIPEVRLIEPEGTYLIWLDFRKLGLKGQKLEELIVKKARLWLDGGTMFGPEGDGFQRVNIASPRGIIKQAMEQLRDAVASLGQ